MTTPTGSIKHQFSTTGNVPVNIIIWEIPNFRYYINDSHDEQSIQSPIFTQGPLSASLLIKVYLSEEMEIFYRTAQSVVLISVRISYGSLGSFIVKESVTVQPNQWEYISYFNFLHLYDVIMNGKKLCLKFEYSVQENDLAISNFHASSQPVTQLITDLENLFNGNTYSDVVMKSADNEEFKVHKALLATRSPVLKAHFEHKFTENTTNIVGSHLESKVLREVLYFIYTDRTPKLEELSEDLLSAADFYQLDQLKSLCENALQKKLNVNNAIITLQLADSLSAKELKQKTLEFIKNKGHLKRIIKTQAWIGLQSVDLIKEVCDYCI